MIDYDKLNTVHGLINKLEGSYITVNYGSGWAGDTFMVTRPNGYLIYSSDIDFIIAQLREITQEEPKAKYTLGDELWYLHHQEIESFISVKTLGRTHYDGEYWWHEDYLYPTKASLIEAQLKYWLKSKQEDCQHDFNSVFNFYDESGSKYYQGCSKCKLQKPDECQHESDGFAYNQLIEGMDILGSIATSEAQFKCKKCGEFYR